MFPKSSKGKKILWPLYIALLVIGGVIGFMVVKTMSPPQPEPAAEVVTHSTDTPDENKPDETFTWHGGANDPKKIAIPSIGVDAYMQNVGVDQKNEVAVPTNIHFAGWFVDSVRPGEMGHSIVDGHLNGPNADGIFIDLEKVQTGAEVSIEFGDGSKKNFEVREVRVVDLDKAASVLFSQSPDSTHQLTLVTCGGEYDRESQLYDKRVIVRAELV